MLTEISVHPGWNGVFVQDGLMQLPHEAEYAQMKRDIETILQVGAFDSPERLFSNIAQAMQN